MERISSLVLSMLLLASCQDSQQIKVHQLNIWQEGTQVENGYNQLVSEIASVNADFVTLSEVRNYDGSRFCDRLVQSLQEKGLQYHSFYSYDSGLLSKYPIIDSMTVFPEQGDHGSVYKLVAQMPDCKVAVYTAHLDYQSCAYYDVRGYCGNTWEELEKPLTDLPAVLKKNEASYRDDAIRLFLADAEKERERGSLIFLGGDFNEPSHLDWNESTKDKRDHQGMVIPWTVTTLLEEQGYLDSYREKYPNPVENPGFTYPADCLGAKVSKLSWAPKADERERIDYIFYSPSDELRLKDVVIHGPKGNILRAKRVDDYSEDRFIEPTGQWMSDHKGLVATFIYKPS